MNYEELDRRLHELSGREKENKAGIAPLERFKVYPDMDVSSFSDTYIRFIIDTTMPYMEWVTDTFTLHKHDRFAPAPLHNHPWFELMYVYSGSCRHMIRGKAVSLEKGQAVLLSPNTEHEIEYCGEDDIAMNLIFLPNFLKYNSYGLGEDGILKPYLLSELFKTISSKKYIVFNSENSRRLPILIKEAMIEYYEPGPGAEFILSSLASLIFQELERACSVLFPIDEIQNTVLLKVMDRMEKNMGMMPLSEIAEDMHYSPNYINRLLKKATGQSYSSLSQKLRLNRAKQLLLYSNMSIQEISVSCGYQNTAFFYRKFKELFNISPGDLRAKK